MKNTIAIICLTFFLLTACNDNLDIQPQQAISTEVALSTEQGVKTALIGAYDLLTMAPTFTGDVILNSELLIDSENLFWTGFSNDLSQIFDKQIVVNSSAIEKFWENGYRTINQVNSILAAIEVVNENERQAVAGEARFLRGMIYFDLINMFGKSWNDGDAASNLGVPIVSLPSEQTLVDPIVPRNTVAEIYQFIIEDLLFAKENLPNQNDVFATNFAASALLSRVYLMQEKYDLAAAEVDRIIASEVFTLLPDLDQVFNQSENTPETIFAVQVTSQDRVNRMSFFYTGEIEGGGGFIGITDEHLTKYETGDKRSALFYLDEQNGIRRTSKWKIKDSNDGNAAFLRLAEMYLTRAESRFRIGNISGALEDLNIIRNRAGLSDLSANEITLDGILKERFLELVFEGHQYRDVKRTQQFVGGLPFNDAKLIYPIPQRELEVNTALVQNEGY